MGGANGGGKPLDFNMAYFRRHGRIQRHVGRKNREVAVEAIIRAPGRTLKNVVGTIDLEAGESQEPLLRNVRQGDAVLVKAGRADFHIVFTHVDEHGRLAGMSFNNGRYEAEHKIMEGETEKIWGGMLMSFSPFTLRMRRLQLHSAAQGVLGCVEITAFVEPQAAY